MRATLRVRVRTPVQSNIYCIYYLPSMNNQFSPKRLTLKLPRTEQKSLKPPLRHRPGEKFLKGPIPWNWLSSAACLPGQSLHVAIVIWFLSGVTKNRVVTLSGATLRALGVSRHASYRGLSWLEEANLVRVKRHAGRNPIVTILGFNEDDETS